MQFDEFARKREAEAGAFGFFLRTRADLAKLLEHRVEVLRGDA